MPRITDVQLRDLEERVAIAEKSHRPEAPALRAELEDARAARERSDAMNTYLRGRGR